MKAPLSNIKLIVAMLIISIATLGCMKFEEVEVQKVENFKIKDLKESELYFSLDLTVMNPNRSSFTITGSDLDISLNGNELGNTQLDQNLKIEGDSKQTVTVHLKTTLKEAITEQLGGMFLAALTGGIEVGVKGEVTGKCCLFLKKSFPVEHKEKVDLSKFQLN